MTVYSRACVAVGNHGRGPVGPCGRDRQVLPGTLTALKRLWVSSIPSPSGLVVVDALAQPVGPQSFSARFSVLAAGAAVPAVHMHSTRHTVAYLLHEAGEPPVKGRRCRTRQ